MKYVTEKNWWQFKEITYEVLVFYLKEHIFQWQFKWEHEALNIVEPQKFRGTRMVICGWPCHRELGKFSNLIMAFVYIYII